MSQKSETVQFRLNPGVLQKLLAIAKDRDTNISSLVRAWVIERLNQELLVANNSRRQWQMERLAGIERRLESEYPAGPTLVIHVFPLTPGLSVNLSQVTNYLASLLPTERVTPIVGRINRLGYYVETKRNDKETACAQLFKDGRIEMVKILQATESEIFGQMLEHDIVMTLSTYVALLLGLQMPAPFLVSISLLRANGYALIVQPSVFPNLPRIGIEESGFTLPDLIIAEPLPDNLDTMAQTLRPIFDEIWQASGYTGTYSFSKDGHWKGPFV